MITPEFVRQVMADFRLRCAAAKAAGGITSLELMERGEQAPAGYWLDFSTDYWLPPGVVLAPFRVAEGR